MSHEALRGLRHFLDRSKYTSVVVASNPNASEELAIQRLSLHDDVAKSFLEAVKAIVADGDEVVFKPYEPGYKPELHELCVLGLVNEPEVAEIIESLSDVDSIELFSASDDFVDGLRFYAVVVGGTTRKALFLRTYSRVKEISRRGGFAVMLRGGTYNHLQSKVFLFDEQVDCFVWDGVAFIANITQFQRIFAFFERVKAQSDATLKRINKRVPIGNLDELRQACRSHSLMAAKVASIARKPYLERVKMDDVKRAIADFELAIELVKVNGEDQIVFDPALEKRWLILKLLDDDYLGSVMTSEKYDVNSKSRHSK